MSGLEYLEDVKKWLDNNIITATRLNQIEKELKVLNILKIKHIDIDLVLRAKNLFCYNLNARQGKKLNQEDFDLIREVMLWLG